MPAEWRENETSVARAAGQLSSRPLGGSTVAVSMNTTSIDELLAIFNSSGDTRREDASFGLDDLLDAIGAGVVAVTKQVVRDGRIFTRLYSLCVTRVETPPHTLRRQIPELAPFVFSAGGGLFHQQLVLLGVACLLDAGIKPDLEIRREGKLVDIAAADGSWIIECGDTSPQPVTSHLAHACDRFGVIPFQPLGLPASLVMHVFTRGSAWSDTVSLANSTL